MDFVLRLLVTAPPLLLSLTLHEFAHARTALAFGDPTAKYMGRVTLNPLAHLDPLGTICLLFSGFIGWAKPVPVNTANLHPRALGNFSVSLAGPATNLMLAIAAGLVLRIVLPHVDNYYLTAICVQSILMAMLLATMLANLGLFAFNLIPLFPLDGSHMLQELLPLHMQHRYIDWQRRFGMFLLGALVFGPRILKGMSGGQTIDPIGYLFSAVFGLGIRALDFDVATFDKFIQLLQLLSGRN
jgi:Zn-dependent protease